MQISDEMVEKAARRMAVADGKNPDKLSHNSFEWWRHYVPMARAVLEPALSAAEPVAWQPRYKQEVIDHHKSIGSDLCEYAMTVYPTKEQAQGYGYGGYECRALYAEPQPAPSVAVKALGWKAHNEGFSHGRMHYGTGAFGHWYGVSRVNTGCWACVHHVDGKPVHLPMTESLDSAKAAAQADYEARILSALSAQVQDESEVIECLLAGKPFVFDPATNFCHADDGGAPEHGIKYVPTAQVQDVAAGVMASIAEERKKQIAKGYDVSHDDAHDTYEIIDAPWGAAARINVARSFRDQHNISGYKAALIQAAAQIVAEIERLDRAAAPAKQEG